MHVVAERNLTLAEPEPDIATADVSSHSPNSEYTDAPLLNRNVVLGSVQVVWWLLFHPSAWRNHLLRVDSKLSPDFSLASLNGVQWGNGALRRLIIQSHVVLPVLALTIATLVSCITAPGSEMLGTYLFLSMGLTISLATSLVISASAGVVSFVVFLLAFGALCLPIKIPVDIAAVAACGFAVAVATTTGMNESGVSGDTVVRRKLISMFCAPLLALIVLGVVWGTVHGAGFFLLFPVKRGIASFATVFPILAVSGAVSVALAVALRYGLRPALTTVALLTPLWVGPQIMIGIAIDNEGGLREVENLVNAGWFSAFFAGMMVVVYGWCSALLVLSHTIAWRFGDKRVAAFGSSVVCVFPQVVGVGIYRVFNGLDVFALVIAGIVGLCMGWSCAKWRPFLSDPILAVWNIVLYFVERTRRNSRRSLLPFNSVFWNEFQRLRPPFLAEHLNLVIRRNMPEGKLAQEYLATAHLRWGGAPTTIELVARQLERCSDPSAIAVVHESLEMQRLDERASEFVGEFDRISRSLHAAETQTSVYSQRSGLHEVARQLESLERRLIERTEPYAVRLRQIAIAWNRLVRGHALEVGKQTELSGELRNPYVAGVVLTEESEIFVGRTEVSARLERILIGTQRHAVLLYGQQRMGKTSLLRNLGRLLPRTIVPLFVDLQGFASQSSDYGGFLLSLSSGMSRSLKRDEGLGIPPLNRDDLGSDPFRQFENWLDDLEGALGSKVTALLALDEFESLDATFESGRLEAAVILGMLRNLIEHRRQLRVLLAGSHTIGELRRWSSYLGGLELVHLGFLEDGETRRLIEHPVRDFPLRYEPDATQRIIELTRGHPYFLQRLCFDIVAKKSEQSADRGLACLADVEAAVPEALRQGRLVLDSMSQSVDESGVALLRFVASRGERAVVTTEEMLREFGAEFDKALSLPVRRELIESTSDGYRFQVEIVRRWFASQG